MILNCLDSILNYNRVRWSNPDIVLFVVDPSNTNEAARKPDNVKENNREGREQRYYFGRSFGRLCAPCVLIKFLRNAQKTSYEISVSRLIRSLNAVIIIIVENNRWRILMEHFFQT